MLFLNKSYADLVESIDYTFYSKIDGAIPVI